MEESEGERDRERGGRERERERDTEREAGYSVLSFVVYHYYYVPKHKYLNIKHTLDYILQYRTQDT